MTHTCAEYDKDRKGKVTNDTSTKPKRKLPTKTPNRVKKQSTTISEED